MARRVERNREAPRAAGDAPARAPHDVLNLKRLLQRMEDAFSAVAFAEEGEVEMARRIAPRKRRRRT